MRELGLDHLSLFDVAPAELVRIAAQIGCRWVGLFTEPVPFEGAAIFDMNPGGAAFRETKAALDDTGLRVAALDPFLLPPETDFGRLERGLEIGAGLDARGANVVVLDSDPTRREDNLALLMERAKAFGLAVMIEPYPLSEIRTIGEAVALTARVAGAEIGLTIDSLHVRRGGGSWADVAALPPGRMAYVQLSDGPLEAPRDLAVEAVYERGAPGKGEFDLAALIALVPDHVPLSIEAPSQRLKAKGLTPLQRAEHLTAGLRQLL